MRSSRGRSAMLCRPTRSSRPLTPEDLVLGDAELLDEQLEHLRRDGLLHLQAHGRAEAPPQQLLLQRLEKVLRVVLLDLEVLVAGDPERVDLEHVHAREEALEVLADDVLERDEPLVAERHEPAEDGRDLDPREVLLAGRGVAHQHGEVERETRDVGERVGGVDGQGGQHREDALLEEALAVLLLLAVEVGPAHQVDALLGQGGHELVAEQPGVTLHLEAGLGPDQLEHLARHQAGGRAHGHVGRDPALEPGHADHEELVEVAGEDRREPHPLEQRQRRVLRLSEHAPAVGAATTAPGRGTGRRTPRPRRRPPRRGRTAARRRKVRRPAPRRRGGRRWTPAGPWAPVWHRGLNRRSPSLQRPLGWRDGPRLHSAGRRGTPRQGGDAAFRAGASRACAAGAGRAGGSRSTARPSPRTRS